MLSCERAQVTFRRKASVLDALAVAEAKLVQLEQKNDRLRAQLQNVEARLAMAEQENQGVRARAAALSLAPEPEEEAARAIAAMQEALEKQRLAQAEALQQALAVTSANNGGAAARFGCTC